MGLFRLTIVSAKLYCREPAAIFFTLVFPAMLLVVFGAIFGNNPYPGSDSPFGYIDMQVPALAAIIIGSVALIGIPVSTSSDRETGVLRRYRATPISPLTIICANVLVNFVMSVGGLAILILLGRMFFELRFTGSWPGMFAAFTFLRWRFLRLAI